MGAAAGIGCGTGLCNHQREPPVYDGFTGKELGQIPYLLMPQLKGHGSAGKSQTLQEQKCPGVEHVKTEIPADFQAKTGGNREMPEVPRQNAPEKRRFLQQVPEPVFVSGPENSRQHGEEIRQPGKRRKVCRFQQLQGNIESGYAGGQLRRQLVCPGD